MIQDAPQLLSPRMTAIGQLKSVFHSHFPSVSFFHQASRKRQGSIIDVLTVEEGQRLGAVAAGWRASQDVVRSGFAENFHERISEAA